MTDDEEFMALLGEATTEDLVALIEAVDQISSVAAAIEELMRPITKTWTTS